MLTADAVRSELVAVRLVVAALNDLSIEALAEALIMGRGELTITERADANRVVSVLGYAQRKLSTGSGFVPMDCDRPSVPYSVERANEEAAGDPSRVVFGQAAQ